MELLRRIAVALVGVLMLHLTLVQGQLDCASPGGHAPHAEVDAAMSGMPGMTAAAMPDHAAGTSAPSAPANGSSHQRCCEAMSGCASAFDGSSTASPAFIAAADVHPHWRSLPLPTHIAPPETPPPRALADLRHS